MEWLVLVLIAAVVFWRFGFVGTLMVLIVGTMLLPFLGPIFLLLMAVVASLGIFISFALFIAGIAVVAMVVMGIVWLVKSLL